MSSMRSASSSTRISTVSRRNRSVGNMVEKTSRCCDEDIHTTAQRTRLRILVHAAKDGSMFQVCVATISRKTVADLLSQFARRREDQRANTSRVILAWFVSVTVLAMGRNIASQSLQDRQRKCGCLTGSGLGTRQNIFPLQHKRYDPLLNRCRCFITGCMDRIQKRLGQPQFIKFHQECFRCLNWRNAPNVR